MHPIHGLIASLAGWLLKSGQVLHFKKMLKACRALFSVVSYLKLVLFVYSVPKDAPEHDSFYVHRCNMNRKKKTNNKTLIAFI